jgi:tetratricopeptide (TPR) repeat protein
MKRLPTYLSLVLVAALATAAGATEPKLRAGRAARPGLGERGRRPPAIVLPAPREKGGVQLPVLVRLGDMLLASGQVSRAINFYDQFRFNFDSEPLYWRRFAALYEHAGDLERALACLEHVSRLDVNVVDDAIKESELLWRLQRPKAALTRLRDAKPLADENDTRYWQLLFELAWAEEREPLAIESLEMLWRSKRTSTLARDLCSLLGRNGEYAKGAQTALEAVEERPNPILLLMGMRLAVEGRRQQAADALIQHASARESYYRNHAEYFLARALYATLRDRSRDANRDFSQALTMDPQLEDVCPLWLEASVTLEHRSMAEAALERCGDSESRRPASWDVLADVYSMLGRRLQAEHWRTLARQQSSWAEPGPLADRPTDLSTLEHELLDAIERDDKPSVQQAMIRAGAPFRLSYQVAALQAVNRPDEAWALLESGGYADRNSTPASREEASLVKKALRMRSDWLSGAWAKAEAVSLGSLRVLGQRVWVEQRFRPVYVGLEAGHNFLEFAPDAPFQFSSHELELGLWARRRRTNTDSKLVAGGRLLGRNSFSPYARLQHSYHPAESRLHLELRGFLGDPPVYTGLLRATALRDGVEVVGGWALPRQFAATASVGASRFVLRDRRMLSSELTATAELARRFEMEYWSLRPRIFLSQNTRRNRTGLASIVQGLGGDTGGDELALQQVQLGDYSSAGFGAAVGNDLGAPPQGRGPHLSFRYGISGWAAYVLPTLQQGYGFEAHLSVVFARRQELAAAGFLYGGWREAIAEPYGGVSLTYVARWF